VFPGKTLSDVNIPEVSIDGFNIYNTVHNYNIKKSGTITGKAAILEPQIETNIWVASLDATQQQGSRLIRFTTLTHTLGLMLVADQEFDLTGVRDFVFVNVEGGII